MNGVLTTSDLGIAGSASAGERGIYDARILIADDEPMCCRLLAGILRQQNFANLRFAYGGGEALQLIKSFKPDLVLLDMQMPDLDGMEVCRQVRMLPDFADVPILVQTATVDRKQMGKLFAAGASDFLSKPINPSELVARVTVHLERRKMLGELREYRRRTSHELDAARRMQFELLPSATDQQALAESAGLRIGSYYRSSSEIGGDIWGLLPIDASSFGIFLADFTGHGVTAALNTFRLHALIHNYRSLRNDPVGLVSMLNDRLARLLPIGQFATFLYLIVNHAESSLQYVSAGAPAFMIKQGLLEPCHLTEAVGVPLGISRGETFELHHSPFSADSMLVLFSDGLAEFPDSNGGRIGEEGIKAVTDRCDPGLTPHQVIDELCRSAGMTEHGVLPDDTTIVCLDRRVGPRLPTGRDCTSVQPPAPPTAPECVLLNREAQAC
ncbi:PP2C family protein-serine/threonine phosphatase [Bradyrhizobium sp.]|uniref:PP2C family protein-serine/threonine phosphatase n=1 Tax=Bradyrhizobium sp. TaxID=376 RepID=UPI003C35B536